MKITPILQIGKSSVTPELISAVDEALEARELIKMHILKNCFDDPKEIAQVIADAYPFGSGTGDRKESCALPRVQRQ